MENEGSLPQSQVPTTCPYPEPDQSSPYPPHTTSWRSILIISSHLRPGLPSGLFPSGFPTKTLYMPLFSLIHATCSTHLILLDFITRTILGEVCRSLSYSLWSSVLPAIKKNPWSVRGKWIAFFSSRAGTSCSPRVAQWILRHCTKLHNIVRCSVQVTEQQ